MIYSGLTNLPDPFASSNTKNDKKYGTAMANYILSSTSDYIDARNKRFAFCRALADGRQDLTDILQMANIGTEKTYTNISLKASALAKKFEHIVVDGYMESTSEHFKATALSNYIREKKTEKKSKAEFRMENPELIAGLSQEVGFPVEDPNAFTPESKEHSDIYFQLNDDEKEELLYNEILEFVSNDIDIESLKRRKLSELFQLNLYGTYNYIDDAGRQKVDFIQGEDCYYSQSYRDDFKDIWFAGRKIRMTASKLRSRFKVDDEKTFFEAIRNSKYGGGSAWDGEWREDYRTSSSRPYDSTLITLTHVWAKLSKGIEILEGKDKFDRDIFDISYEYGHFAKKEDGKRKVNISKIYPETAYEGYFLGDKNYCLEWEEQRRIVRDGFDKGEVLCPFIFFMCDNNGKMNTQSPLESVEDYIQNMDLAVLKIKQVIANTAPAGLAFDLMALGEMDLGTGKLDPLEIARIYKQTGDVFYKSRSEDGQQTNLTPIRPIAVDLANLINPFISVYNLNLGMIRDVLGVNEFRDGTSTSPRVSQKFAQSQLSASNTATINMYRGYIKGTESLGKQMGIRIWMALKNGNENKGYLAFLGKENKEFIKNSKDIIESTYNFKLVLAPTQAEREQLEADISLCLQNQSLLPEDAIVIRETVDKGLKVARRYLSYMTERRRKLSEETQANLAKQTADANAQAGQMVEQEKQKSLQTEMQADQNKAITKGEQDRALAMEKFAWELILNSQTTGAVIPPMYQQVVDMVLQNRGMSVSKELQSKEEQEQMEAQQREQEAMQGDIEQQAQQIQQAVEAGELSEEQGQMELQQLQGQMQGAPM